MVQSGIINTDNQILDVSTLANGSYVLRLSEGQQIIGYQQIIKN
jgi:hypothetical protein